MFDELMKPSRKCVSRRPRFPDTASLLPGAGGYPD